MAQQLSDPFSIPDVCLPPGDLLDMLSIDNEHLYILVLQQVVDGLSADARTLHGHMSAPVTEDPVHHLVEFIGHGAKRANLLRLRRNDAGNNVLLVDVQSAASLVYDTHIGHPLTTETATWRPIQ